ncbi:MAG: hypothetical protein LC637_05020, partial [Xanthomonadaceae bacterium]|nr:hypothetical protein [Xanthomonadaceae bacterium]
YLISDRECYDDEILFRIAHFAQVDPMQIIGAIHAKKAKTDEVRSFWQKAAKKGVAGLGAVSFAGLLTVVPDPVQAGQHLTNITEEIYIMRSWRRFTRWARSLWHPRCLPPALC